MYLIRFAQFGFAISQTVFSLKLCRYMQIYTCNCDFVMLIWWFWGTLKSLIYLSIWICCEMKLSFKLFPVFLQCCAISTGVLFYWRGTWLLLDSYLFPNHPHWSAWASLLIGVFGMIIHQAYSIWSSVDDGDKSTTVVQEINLDNCLSDDQLWCALINLR